MNVKFRIPAFVVFTACLLIWPFAGTSQNQQPAGNVVDPAVFKEPPAEFRGHEMYGYGQFNLSNLSEEHIISGIQAMVKQNMGGFVIEPNGGSTTGLPADYLKATRREPVNEGVVYLSEEFFKFYRLALQEARKYGLEAVLYDEWMFPTGKVGGQFYAKYPQHVAKSLEMAEENVTGPGKTELAVPANFYVGAVMMNRDTFELVDISSRGTPGKTLVAQVPKGNWKVMVFYLDPTIQAASQKGTFVDYLDSTAMDAFISLSYQRMFDHIGEFFGKEIKFSFWDEPAMHNADGRLWTPSFNQNFEKQYGFSPMKYYPALWYNIGPQTAAARNALFGFRAHLFATNFVQKIEDFCEAHGIKAGGHFDQEEIVNPVPVNGDFIKLFEHQGVPAVDDIWSYGRSNPGYKIVTSAAYNYDKPVVFAETYAGYPGLAEKKTVYKVAMDQYAMGVNLQVTSGGPTLWNSAYVPEFNRFLGRMSYLLQYGRHVADIAVLYPIASLQTAYKFDGGQHAALPPGTQAPNIYAEASAVVGGITPPEIDYQNIGEALFRGLRVDYTYLHPEVLAGRCIVDGQKLILNNQENREEYSVLIVPGGDTLSVAAAAKIREFYDKGGVVISTSKLPTKSAEFGRDKEIQKFVADVFGLPVNDPPTADLQRAMDNRLITFYFYKRNKAGGQAYFLPQVEPWVLHWVLGRVLPVRDVDIQEPMPLLKKAPDYDGALTYLHKLKNGKDIYFFANSTDRAVDTKAVLRGKKALRIWNPQTGEPQQAEFTTGEANGQPITTVHLVLPPVTAMFYVED
jgi:hypothetical protein